MSCSPPPTHNQQLILPQCCNWLNKRERITMLNLTGHYGQGWWNTWILPLILWEEKNLFAIYENKEISTYNSTRNSACWTRLFLGCFLGGNIVLAEVWCSRGGGGTWPVCHAVTATNSGYFAWVCHPNCRLPRLPLSSLPHGSLGLGVLCIIGHPHHGSLASKDFDFWLCTSHCGHREGTESVGGHCFDWRL